jgi:hypothetical protein
MVPQVKGGRSNEDVGEIDNIRDVGNNSNMKALLLLDQRYDVQEDAFAEIRI